MISKVDNGVKMAELRMAKFDGLLLERLMRMIKLVSYLIGYLRSLIIHGNGKLGDVLKLTHNINGLKDNLV